VSKDKDMDKLPITLG